MRWLHTADWHLGGRFHDRRRGEDEDDALNQLVEVCARRVVDAVLIAGDVFDNANPGAEDQERYYRCLSRLVGEAGVATVVVVAGNHDSALRLEGPRQLLEPLGIHVVGRLGCDQEIGGCLVPVKDRQGEVRAVAIALPYLRDADLRLADYGETAAQAPIRYRRAFEARYAQAAEAARALYGGLPRVVIGHCLIDGGAMGGGERPVQVGNLGGVSAEAIAGDAAYLALGHLHQPQKLVGRLWWRYCGSLLPTGFDETGSARSVTLFDLDATGRAVDFEEIVLRPWRRYARLHGNVDALRDQVFQLEIAAADAPTPFCEAVLELERPEPGMAQELIEQCKARGWDLVSVRRGRPAAQAEAARHEAFSLQELEPEEVFIRRHELEYGSPPDAELLLDFRALLESVTAADAG
jgi:exonuclease SbcD